MFTPSMTRSQAVSKSLNALLREDIEAAVSISSDYSGGAGSLFDNETADIARVILTHDYTPPPSASSPPPWSSGVTSTSPTTQT